ncbi:MAG TPA: DUF2252 domain-containing protein [Solirubrobacterales bacterium]|jgi:uncharacterized protein (DUF2252 family)|nr:DUF2252 domain-containing protein [Solirubrobacterales bacterium]
MSITSPSSPPDSPPASGKEARKLASRSSQAAWTPGPDRVGPLEVLAEQDETRVPELVPVRYGRMLASAFTFYRGAAAIMAADLAASPDSGLRVQLCGDAHLSNFGVFQAPDRRLVFDINDFDETLPGPFEWDVKRLAASVAIGARDRGFSGAEGAAAVLSSVGAYRTAMGEFAAMGDLDVWYARLDIDEAVAQWQQEAKKADRRKLQKNLDKARNKDSLRALKKLTETVDGHVRIADRPPLLVPIDRLAEREGRDPAEITKLIQGLLHTYSDSLDDQAQVLAARYHYVDAAHKVVGVGSVGTRAWIALLFGRDEQDPLFLQMKEAGPSVLEPFAGASEYDNHGHRVVAGQRLTQAAGDVLLGWLTVEGLDGKKRDFYVRQLWDGKGSAEIETMSASTMATYAGLCGRSLARAHARTGDRQAIAAYLGHSDKFDRAITEFSEAYADQNEADYTVLKDAERAGLLKVESGV